MPLRPAGRINGDIDTRASNLESSFPHRLASGMGDRQIITDSRSRRSEIYRRGGIREGIWPMRGDIMEKNLKIQGSADFLFRRSKRYILIPVE